MNEKLIEIFEKIRESEISIQKAENEICNGLIEKFKFAEIFDLTHKEIIILIKQYFDVEDK